MLKHATTLALCLCALATTATAREQPVFNQGAITYRDDDAHTLENENLFGFTLGSDIDHEGARGIAVETMGGFGRREGRYGALNSKLEFSWAATRNLSVAGSLLAGYWNIRGNSTLPDTNAMRFRGVGGEIRWRWLDRATSPIGLTLHIEPSVAIADEADGAAGNGFAAENKLIIDAELVKNRLWGAINLVYDVERFRPWASGTSVEEGSVGGVTGALATRLTGNFFVGAEMRALWAFNGATLGRQVGNALYIGPSAYWRITDAAWLSVAWNIQVAGHENNDPRRLDLTNFSRNVVRVKFGWEF